MAGFVLFETTESAIEILWDIALALFIIRLAFVYFALNLASGLFVAYLTYTQLTHTTQLTTAQAECFLAIPAMLALSALWARYVIMAYEVPRVTTFRLATGGVALVFMVLADLLAGLVFYGEGQAAWIFKTGLSAGVAFAVLLAAFALMPAAMMVFEERPGEAPETTHGHEKKSIVDAVPTVNRSEKKQKKTQ